MQYIKPRAENGFHIHIPTKHGNQMGQLRNFGVSKQHCFINEFQETSRELPAHQYYLMKYICLCNTANIYNKLQSCAIFWLGNQGCTATYTGLLHIYNVDCWICGETTYIQQTRLIAVILQPGHRATLFVALVLNLMMYFSTAALDRAQAQQKGLLPRGCDDNFLLLLGKLST